MTLKWQNFLNGYGIYVSYNNYYQWQNPSLVWTPVSLRALTYHKFYCSRQPNFPADEESQIPHSTFSYTTLWEPLALVEESRKSLNIDIKLARRRNFLLQPKCHRNVLLVTTDASHRTFRDANCLLLSGNERTRFPRLTQRQSEQPRAPNRLLGPLVNLEIEYSWSTLYITSINTQSRLRNESVQFKGQPTWRGLPGFSACKRNTYNETFLCDKTEPTRRSPPEVFWQPVENCLVSAMRAWASHQQWIRLASLSKN